MLTANNIVNFVRRASERAALLPTTAHIGRIKIYQRTLAGNVPICSRGENLVQGCFVMATPEVGICQTTNRRHSLRIPVKPLVYLTKETDTLGFILNLSEDGMAIQALEVLRQGRRMGFRFPLPKTKIEISGTADVIWGDSTGRAGLKFASLGEFDRFRLHRWIAETQPTLYST